MTKHIELTPEQMFCIIMCGDNIQATYYMWKGILASMNYSINTFSKMKRVGARSFEITHIFDSNPV